MPVGCPYYKKEGGGHSSGGREKGGLTLSWDKFNKTEVLKLNIMVDIILKVCLQI